MRKSGRTFVVASAGIALALTVAGCGSNPAAGPTSENTADQSANATASGAHSPLEILASASEDFMDAAIAANADGENSAIAKLKDELARLTPDESGTWQGLVEEMEREVAAGNHTAGGLDAAELYKGLVDAQEWSGSAVPKDVALLDYDGFRAAILASSPSPDWEKLQGVARDASARVSGLAITEPNLADVTGGIVISLAHAADTQATDLAKSSADQLLAVVDLLEAHYEAQ